LASLLGTVLQVAMVVAGHYNKSVASLFAVGGMGLSLIAGLLYAMWARGNGTAPIVAGGFVAGATCAFIGILVSHLLGDVPRSLLVLGTISSAITGALGGWLGTFLFRSGIAAAVLIAIMSGSANAQNASSIVTDTRPIVSEVVVEASAETVWTAWTTGAGLRAWLAPHAEIDLRLGGLMRTNYNQQGTLGDPQTIENTILSFEPSRMLSIRVTKFAPDFPFPNAVGDMWTVIYLEPAGEGRTRVRVVGLGFRTDEESQRMRTFFDRGNAVTLRQLQNYFSRASQ
jgi:uncharacterized protein YndB with AHSA1/START domain